MRVFKSEEIKCYRRNVISWSVVRLKMLVMLIAQEPMGCCMSLIHSIQVAPSFCVVKKCVNSVLEGERQQPVRHSCNGSLLALTPSNIYIVPTCSSTVGAWATTH